MTIGKVARDTGIGIETPHFYERSGLLDRPWRTDGGYRLYDADTLSRLKFIKRTQVLGFTLQEIKRMVSESHEFIRAGLGIALRLPEPLMRIITRSSRIAVNLRNDLWNFTPIRFPKPDFTMIAGWHADCQSIYGDREM